MQNQETIIPLMNTINLPSQDNKEKLSKNEISIPNKEIQISSPMNQLRENENELDNIKTQLTPLPPSDNSCKFPSMKKNNIKELKIEMFLCKKRKCSFSENEKNKMIEDKNINNNKIGVLKDKNFNIKNNNKEGIVSLMTFKANKNNKCYNLHSFHFNKNKNNKFEFKKNNKTNKNNSKIKTICDYYKSTRNKENHANINEIKLFYNKEKLLKTIEEQEIIIDSKIKEISVLKQTKLENEELISLLKEQKNISDEEIKKCREDISIMLKEISKLKRENKIKWLNEQEYNLGKVIIGYKTDLNKRKKIEIWKEGKEFSDLKEKIRQNQYQIDVLKNNEKNNNLLTSFKLDSLLKAKSELNDALKKLEKEKYLYLYQQNLFDQEKTCTFSPSKKDGLPFLKDRYQILELIGKGGYSEVYKAYDVQEHKYVACKLIQLNENWPEEIKQSYLKHTIRENSILQQLNYHAIIKLYDTIEIDENSFCNILEYCSGPDLALFIKQNSFISEKIARIIIYQILQALLYLNNLSKKIIHYDLKPENILFNDNMQVKLTDFGLAKIMETNTNYIQLTSQGVGTYWYLPPECFDENKNIEINSKVDIWSLGVISYEMLFNKKPFGHEYFSQKYLVRDNIIKNAYMVEFPEKPEISEECKDFIRNCLKYKESERYDVYQAINSKFIKNCN